MSKVEIFDPAMCCSTGVCGPGVDPELLRVATIISNLQKIGKDIERHNLADDPDAYIKNKTVNDVLKDQGVDALPIILVDGKVVLTGQYPSNQQFAEWTDTTLEELVTILVKDEMEKSSCCEPEEGSCCGTVQTSCCNGNSSAEGCC